MLMFPIIFLLSRFDASFIIIFWGVNEFTHFVELAPLRLFGSKSLFRMYPFINLIFFNYKRHSVMNGLNILVCAFRNDSESSFFFRPGCRSRQKGLSRLLGGKSRETCPNRWSSIRTSHRLKLSISRLNENWAFDLRFLFWRLLSSRLTLPMLASNPTAS